MRRRITFRAIALLSGDITQLQTSLQQLVRDCRRLGLDRITPHGLRHTFATGSISTGDSVNGVQGMLGHSNVHTTLDIYSHVTRGMQRGISDHWDAMLNALTKITQRRPYVLHDPRYRQTLPSKPSNPHEKWRGDARSRIEGKKWHISCAPMQ